MARKAKFLTKEEEIELGYDIKAWREDKDNEEKRVKAIESAHKLFMANQFYAINRAIYFVKATQAKYYDIEDAKVDACIGLMRAIWRYDPTRNAKITTVSKMPIYKELFIRCNGDEYPIKMKDGGHVDYAKAKKKWLESGFNKLMSLHEFIKENNEDYNNIYDHVIEIENVINGISSLDYTVKDDGGRDIPFGNIIPDSNNISYYEQIDYIEGEVFSEDMMNVINEHLTPLQKSVLLYEYDGRIDKNKNQFLAEHSISARKFTIEFNKSIKKLREVLTLEMIKEFA